MRPLDLCFCPAIPSVDNRTRILILQHRRERFHAMNSARIVHQSLQRCELIAEHTERLAARFNATRLSDNVGVLYPQPEARLLSKLPPPQRPDQLIILDGTWSHAKTLIRDIPRLRSLPRYRLAPSSPSRYRIRREPNAESLSTLEATVAALRQLEPETGGLDALLGAFERMIDDQLEHPKSNWRRNRRRRRGASNIPRAISSGNLSRIVVAYGEQPRGGPGHDADLRLPIFWVAQRLCTGERFRCAVESDSIHDDEFLSRMRLTAANFREAVPMAEFRRRWIDFLRPNDSVVVHHPSTAKMLCNVDPRLKPAVILKSVKLAPRGNLDDVVRSLGIKIEPRGTSRADQRLASAIALVNHLHTMLLAEHS